MNGRFPCHHGEHEDGLEQRGDSCHSYGRRPVLSETTAYVYFVQRHRLQHLIPGRRVLENQGWCTRCFCPRCRSWRRTYSWARARSSGPWKPSQRTVADNCCLVCRETRSENHPAIAHHKSPAYYSRRRLIRVSSDEAVHSLFPSNKLKHCLC